MGSQCFSVFFVRISDMNLHFEKVERVNLELPTQAGVADAGGDKALKVSRQLVCPI